MFPFRLVCGFALAFGLGGCALVADPVDYDDFSVEQLYALAEESMQNGQWETAVDDLRRVEGRFPYSKYARQVQLDLIFVYYQASLPEQTQAAAERFLRLNPQHQHADYAYYLNGLAQFEEDPGLFGQLTSRNDLSDRDEQAMRAALAAFDDLLARFPDSRYAEDARARSTRLHEALGAHEVRVAIYYYTRGAYLAAVNRAKAVLEDHEQAIHAAHLEVALGLLLHGYWQMNLPELAEDSRRVLALNYPESPYLQADDGTLFTRPWYSPPTETESWTERWQGRLKEVARQIY